MRGIGLLSLAALLCAMLLLPFGSGTAQGDDLPALTIGSFSRSRTWHTVSTHYYLETFRDLLEANFDVTYVELDELTEEGLADVHLFWVNAWEVQPLEGEVDVAAAYVEAGGTLLLNAYRNSYSDQWIEPFNLVTAWPSSGVNTVTAEVVASNDPIVDGLFGLVEEFTNRNASRLLGLGGATFEEAGVEPLAFDPYDEDKALLALVPRCVGDRRGQAVVLSNFHVFTDPEDAWGGLMHLEQSQILLLNLAESARDTMACEIEVEIDVRPGDDPNTINLASNGKVTVAVLGSAEFDVEVIEVDTVEFAGAPVATKGNGDPMASIEDVDEDGYDDLLLHFETAELDLAPGDTSATLTGACVYGRAITGTDSVRILDKE